MKTKVFFISLVVLFGLGQWAFSTSLIEVDDSDLSAGQPTVLTVDNQLEPDEFVAVKDRDDQKVELKFLYERNGGWIPVSGLQIGDETTNQFGQALLKCQDRGNWKLKLRTEKFGIYRGRRAYEFDLEADCGKNYEIRFQQDSESGQAISIFETLERGRRMLNASVGLDFWTRHLTVKWPSNGDYYSWGTVNITNGHHWDVVAHELGHAIYDFGDLGQFGGGPHKIDECYSRQLALSEGWASFFAAWLYVDLDDPDAKFQYLVPRRAPIQIEHVPEDVCRDITNEWRVTSFFWDLIDLNRDQEEVEENFRLTWDSLAGSNTSGIDKARALLENSGFKKAQVERAWNRNF